MNDLARRLAQATGLPEALAEAVVQTALEQIRTSRPDLSDRVDQMLADPANATEAVSLIVQLSQRLGPRPPQADSPDALEAGPRPAAPREPQSQ